VSSAGCVEIIGRSRGLTRALELAERFARTPLPILLVGATGTGKDVFARRIHEASERRGRFVPVNCGALPREMVESLLFGHRRGAFTGAVETVAGFVEAADCGTLFLDELSSLPPDAQVKLLRVLEASEVARLGEITARPVSFRVVASAQDDLRGLVEAGGFRLDLYERVAGVVLELAPLRERPEDIIPLAEHFAGLQGRCLEPGAVAILLNYEWPGNVRELRTAMERAEFLSENLTLSPRAIAEAIALGTPRSRPGLSGSGLMAWKVGDQSQPHELVLMCRDHNWDVRRTAAALGIGCSTLYRRLRRLGISLRPLRSRTEASGNSPRILT